MLQGFWYHSDNRWNHTCKCDLDGLWAASFETACDLDGELVCGLHRLRQHVGALNVPSQKTNSLPIEIKHVKGQAPWLAS